MTSSATNKHQPLAPEALYHACDPQQLGFTSTAELTPANLPLGQERALEAISFGVEINQHGFNLFVTGEPGLGKRHLLKDILEVRAGAAA
ncbi:MAG: AAA family ATPase, partial [Gammaproteobacteria bacterium]|nr:AAA family ATPase [Gammaproteobacteria bacterium]